MGIHLQKHSHTKDSGNIPEKGPKKARCAGSLGARVAVDLSHTMWSSA
ncbi:hypothetical protein LEMLEM_LOCUS2771 [Lemmus lemmus]